ncbi:MAG: WecB/TagA/CpsF family glycosyltransferase [Candidatus Thiodiazotropha sp. 6PLUC2]
MSNNKVHQLFQKTAIDSASWDLLNFVNQSNPRILAFLNAHAINNAVRNHRFADLLLSCDMLLRDGIGVKIGLKILGLGETSNLNGTDLITKILNELKDKRIAIFGSSDVTLQKTKNKLESNGFKNICSIVHGFHTNTAYMDEVAKHEPELVILCMGMPKQELLANEIHSIAHQSLVICAGGWADFYSETKPRAPLWMRKISLEWLFRLVKEPKRLGKRYTVDIIYYFYVILKTLYHQSKKRINAIPLPIKTENWGKDTLESSVYPASND